MTTITQMLEPAAYTVHLQGESPLEKSVKEAIQKLMKAGVLSLQQRQDLLKWQDWYLREKCGDEAPLILLILDGIDPLLEVEDEEKRFLLLDVRDQLIALLSDLGKAVLNVSKQAKNRDKAVTEIFEEVRQGLMALQANRRENMRELDERIAQLIRRLEELGAKLAESSSIGEEISTVKSVLKTIARECHELLHTFR